MAFVMVSGVKCGGRYHSSAGDDIRHGEVPWSNDPTPAYGSMLYSYNCDVYSRKTRHYDDNYSHPSRAFRLASVGFVEVHVLSGGWCEAIKYEP